MGMQLAGQLPQVLARVTEIDNLNGAGKLSIGSVPDPFGPIAEDDFLFRAAPTPLPRFQIEALAKPAGRFNRAHVGGRSAIADGVAFLIPFRLREHASQLGLPRVGRLPFELAWAAHG